MPGTLPCRAQPRSLVQLDPTLLPQVMPRGTKDPTAGKEERRAVGAQAGGTQPSPLRELRSLASLESVLSLGSREDT